MEMTQSQIKPEKSVMINTPEKIKKQQQENLKYKRDKDRTPVRGIFRFHESPGGTLKFPFRQYPEDPIENFIMKDGLVITIPLGVAKHLNNNCWYPEYEYLSSEKITLGVGDQGIMKVARKVRRCSFESLEFVDIDGLNAKQDDLLTVERII